MRHEAQSWTTSDGHSLGYGRGSSRLRRCNFLRLYRATVLHWSLHSASKYGNTRIAEVDGVQASTFYRSATTIGNCLGGRHTQRWPDSCRRGRVAQTKEGPRWTRAGKRGESQKRADGRLAASSACCRSGVEDRRRYGSVGRRDAGQRLPCLLARNGSL